MRIINQKHESLVERKQEFLTKSPFPFIVLDDFLDEFFFAELNGVLENSTSVMGRDFKTEVESNKSISLNSNLPSMVSSIVDELNKDWWVHNLKELTGMDTLVSTENGNTLLANYHEMKSGGRLGSHVDHSHEPQLGLPHVLNVILYLSSDWRPEFGGATLFFNKNGSKALAKVDYKPNRAVIFLHTPYSFHGVERLQNNGEIKRKTLYVDYYSTSFDPFANMKFDFPNKWFKHDTTFRLPKFFDYLKYRNLIYSKAYLKYIFRKLVG